ncbi:MAG: outer membrane protein transport protein [Sphingomonadaceae bacterium]|nr:outer membrane protein transport protein [Sphingomonadaceae bacterium]
MTLARFGRSAAPAVAALAAAALAAALAAAPALAGGFYLQEQSPRAVGRAFAGEAAIADSAATVFYNPAGMTNLPGVNLDIGTHALFVDSHQQDRGSTRSAAGNQGSFPTGGNDGGNPFAPVVPIPSGYLSAQLQGSRVWFGLGLSAPFGVKVFYNDGWFGRYDTILSDVHSYNIQPSVAYKLNDHFSVGAGFDAQRLVATLTSALPNVSPLLPDGLLDIHGQDFAFGWNLGVDATFGALRLGAHWRSHIDHNLSGTATITGLLGPLAGSNAVVRGFAPLSTPDIATVGAVYALGKARLLAGGSWYKWSRFNAINVNTPSGTTFLSSAQNYRDTWSGSLGVEYDLTPRVTVRAGSMYDQTPTRDLYRTTRVPDGNRVWATAGATAKLNRHVEASLSYAHIFVDTAQVDRTDPLFAGTPAVTTVSTLSTNTGHADEIASSLTFKF